MNPTKEQIISLLAQGIPTSQVAAACGVTDAYVSQLKSDPECAGALTQVDSTISAADVKFDTTLERAEMLALEKIEKNLPFANMGQAMAAFRVLNSARRRKDAVGPALLNQATTLTVNLTLPAAASARYVVNAQNEIVEVEGQTMISATATSLNQLLATKVQSSAPKQTTLTRAAAILDQLSTPRTSVVKPPRRLPTTLSADVL